jgi:hypothetical protein
MARTPIAAAVLVSAVVGCGYQPAPDRRSDPLSSVDRDTVAVALEDLKLVCDLAGSLGEELTPESAHDLTKVARKRPHAVYRAYEEEPEGRPFDGDTMIQLLERAAHKYDDCLQSQADDMRHSAALLRSPR